MLFPRTIPALHTHTAMLQKRLREIQLGRFFGEETPIFSLDKRNRFIYFILWQSDKREIRSFPIGVTSHMEVREDERDRQARVSRRPQPSAYSRYVCWRLKRQGIVFDGSNNFGNRFEGKLNLAFL